MLYPIQLKRFALLCSFVLLVFNCYAQAPNISYSGNLNLYGYKPMNSVLPSNTGGVVPANVYGQINSLNLPSLSTQGYLGIDGPVGIAYDNSNTATNGTIVVADMWKHRIVRINLQANTFTVLAGNGGSGYANGDGVTQAQFKYPSGVLVANNGDIFVADKENHMIRKLTLQGNGTYLVSKLAGHNYTIFGPDPGNENGTGVNAGFRDPESLAFDLNGNIIVADRSNHLIRKVTTTGVVTTIAGDGYRDLLGSGRFADNTNPLLASFHQPTDIAIATNGDIYVADRYNDRIRKIVYNSSTQTYGEVSTFAGRNHGFLDGISTSAAFEKPYGVDFDTNGNLFVSDGDNNRIRKITTAAEVTTIAGSGTAALSDGVGIQASFNMPLGICFDGTANLYVADYMGDKIRKLALTGYSISPALPSGLSFDATNGQISGTPIVGSPSTNYTITGYNLSGNSSAVVNITVNAVAPTLTYASPNVYGANTTITPLLPTITNGIIRNSATSTPTTDFNITKTIISGLSGIFGFTADLNGNKFVGDYNGDIYKYNPSGTRALFKSGLDYITSLASDASGNIYVSDRTNNKIKRITPSGSITHIAGAGILMSGYPDYNTSNPFNMYFYTPVGIAVHTDGTVYIAESKRIFKLTTQGQISIYAGTSNNTSNVNTYTDGFGTSANFKNIKAITVDKLGNLFVADESKLRKVATDRNVTSIADYSSITRTISGTPVAQTLNGVAVDYNGNVYVSTNFYAILKVDQNGNSTTYAGLQNASDAEGVNGGFSIPSQLYMDDYLNLFVYDNGLGKIKSVRPNGIYVKPSLPAGLVLNKFTGEISGTPTTATPATSYVFVAHNDYAYSTTTSTITIAGAPSLTTSAASSITPSSVVLGGNITNNGGATMIERGLVWSTTSTPTIADSKLAQSTNDLGAYTSTITGLIASTTYYVRSYITTAFGTTYGNNVSFTTSAAVLPSIKATGFVNLLSVGTNTAQLTAEIISDGGVALTNTGFCWSTTASPTIAGAHSTDQLVANTFSTTITGLNPDTKYFIRSYATNSIGTRYGNEFVIRTQGIAPLFSYSAPQSLLKDVAVTPIVPVHTGGSVANGILGKLSVFVGSESGSSDGIGIAAKFQEPAQMAIDEQNNIYLTDKIANRIRKITVNGTVTTIGGNGVKNSTDNSNPLLASFATPTGIVMDPYNSLFVGDKYNSKIRKLAASGVVTTFAGNGSNYLVDGIGLNASFSQQNDITMDIFGNIYVADQSNHAIRKITPEGNVSTLAGNGYSGSVDGTGAAARFNFPYGIVTDALGNIFVADRSNHTIRKITPTGIVTTIAGLGTSGFVNGTSTVAKLNYPHGIAIDRLGNLFVADQNNYSVRKITSNGIVSTIAGTGTNGQIASGISADAISSNLGKLTGVLVDHDGNLLLSEQQRILKMNLVGYSISPSLPNGLTLNEQGQIVGTPLTTLTPTTYTITATNEFGTYSNTVVLEVTEAVPAGLTYSSLPIVSSYPTLTATNGTIISTITPTSIGGAITTYSISPSLPAGLNFNTTTGSITGKPTVPSSLTTYTITGINSLGSTTKDIKIEVVDVAPTNLVYNASTLVTNSGQPVTSVTPTSSGGTIQLYTVSPNLPSGLTLNASTGVISGTPLATSSLVTYTITASNGIGTVTSTIDIEVTGDAPIIDYGLTPLSFTKNTPVIIVSPSISSTGNANFNLGTIGFSITPSNLPNGLIFDTNSGSIAGTPTSVTPSTTYTITANNGGNSNSTSVTIEVNDIPPTQLTYPTAIISAAAGTAISSYTPSNAGGDIITYSISPSLPTGLNFNTSTGVISGVPSATTGLNDYVITATNSGGTVTKTISIIVNDAIPSNFTYNVNGLQTFVNGTPINTIIPSITGNVSSYSISPSLPSGLNLNTVTGALTGTPTTPSDPTQYFVTATNSGGSATYSFTISVNDIPPTNLNFSINAVNATNGTYLPPINPSNTGGVIVNYTISPNLPTGLTLNPSTGIISGTPTAPSPSTLYTITGINTGGTISGTITIEVADAAPTGFVYSVTSLVVNTGAAITSITPSAGGGAIVNYAISPALPAGLIFNTNTGVISGTPTDASARTVYTITATNGAGAVVTNIEITVNVLPPSSLTYSTGNLVLTEGTAIASITPVSTGGAIASYTINPSLPAGLTFNTNTGVISGTPSGTSSATVYTITATNQSGAVTFTLSIQVNAISAPANLILNVSTVNAIQGQPINAVLLSQTGGVANYSISPNLPNGLNLNTTTGSITGTPSGTSSATVYTITATNNSGSATVSITIQVASATITPTPNTPILPQGIFNAVNKSILATDTVKFKFNFTDGTAPYTVFLANDKSNRIDTLSNLVDGSIVSLRNINMNTIFSIVKMVDQSNQSRTNNFTKDTVLVNVLKPLLVLNLTSTTPVKTTTGAYLLKLNLIIKNIGDVLLNNVQVIANLKNVFGTAYTFTLTKVAVLNGTARINPNYTGTGTTTGLISELNYNSSTLTKNGKTSFSFSSENDLFSAGTILNLNEENSVEFELLVTPTMVSAPLQLQFASAGSAVLQKEDGSTSSQLAIASSNNATSITNHPNVTGIGTPAPTTVYFAPNTPVVRDQTFILNGINLPNKIIDVIDSYPVGSHIQWCVVSNANLSCDTITPVFPNTLGVHPYLIRSFDYTSSLSSDTIGFKIQLVNKADLLQVQQIIGEPVLQENSTYNIPITITIENKSGHTIDSLLITNQLRSILPAIVDFNIVNVSVSGKLIRNLLYNGDNQDAITTIESKLEQGETAIVQLLININPKGYSGSISSITNVKATTFAGVVNYASSPNSQNNGSGTPTMFTLPELPLKVPEIFTPNRDGVNDYFIVTRSFDTKISLEVYNRWGTKVFVDHNYMNQWDGKSNIISTNQDLVDGGYYYTITATKLNGTTQILKGFIIIQR